MKLHPLLLFVFITFTSSFTTPLQATEPTFCIIGGGAAGSSAAIELSEMGYKKESIHLFDKSHFSGKCDSVSVNGEVIEMGAVLASPVYSHVRYLAEKYSIAFRDHASIEVLEKDKISSLNDYYGIPSPADLVNPFKIPRIIKLLAQMNRYDSFTNKVIDSENHIFKKNIPDQFFSIDKNGQKKLISFEAFTEKIGTPDMARWFEVFINSFGYLPLNKIPALYVYGDVPVSFGIYAWMNDIIKTKRLEKGYSHFINTILDQNRENISLHEYTEVMGIERSLPYSTLTYKDQTNIEQKMSCSHLIIATEPGAIKNLFGTEKGDTTEFEKRLFNEVQYSPYRTIVAKTNLREGAYVIGDAAHHYKSGDAILIANVFHQYPDTMRDTLFYLAEDKDSIKRSTSEAFRHLKNQMAEYGVDVQEVVSDSKGELLDRRWPNYFPHYLDPDFIEQMDDHQGEYNTYYIGSAYSTFELVENTMNHAVRTIQRYFSNDEHPIPNLDRYVPDKNWYGLPGWGRLEK